MAKKKPKLPSPPVKAKKRTAPPAPPTPAKPPAVKKATAKDIEDLLGGPPPAPAAAPVAPPVSSDDDLLAAPGSGNGAAFAYDPKAKPLEKFTRKCKHSAGGELHLYDRTKGAPLAVKEAPDMRWLIVHVPSGLKKPMEQKRPARKLMVLAARGEVPELTPKGATAAAATPSQQTQPAQPGTTPPPVAVQPQTMDEDFNAKSEGPHKVPSVWRKDSRYGLLVYCGRKRAKMVTLERGYVAVDKVRVDDLGTPDQHLELRKQLQALPDTKESEPQRNVIKKQMENLWVPEDAKHTPEHYAAVISKSQLQKTDAARAYLDRVLGAMDDLLATKKADEEDLLS